MALFSKVTKAQVAYNISVISVGHAIVDATCVAVVFMNFPGMQSEFGYFASLVVVYSGLAFSLQAPIGWIVDRFQLPITALLTGCVLTAFSVLAFQLPPIAIALAGIGNAFFHVGGGVISLNINPKSAAMPGIYVAPGDLGLLAGILIGKGGYFVDWPFIAALSVAIVAILFMKKPFINYDTKSNEHCEYVKLILLLLFISVAIRSVIGLGVDLPWKSNVNLLLGLTIAVFFGKALGGILADRFGWIKVSVIGLLLSAPLVSFGLDYPLISITGFFLFNLTMPVTLTAIAEMLPGRTGFAFGVTSLALITGAFPVFIGLHTIFDYTWIIFMVILLSVIALYVSLSLFFHSSLSFNKKPILRNGEY